MFETLVKFECVGTAGFRCVCSLVKAFFIDEEATLGSVVVCQMLQRHSQRFAQSERQIFIRFFDS